MSIVYVWACAADARSEICRCEGTGVQVAGRAQRRTRQLGSYGVEYLPLLIGGVTATVIQHGALRGMGAQ